MARPVEATRHAFVDLLRGYALVVMIETHVVNAYLPEATRHTPFFFWLSFVNGLVAPAFLFASGFSFMLQADRQWDDWLRFGPALRRRLRRIGFIAIIAYYSHLQGLKLSRYVERYDDRQLWKETLQVDILQCIVASLLVVTALVIVVRTRRLFALVAGGFAIAIALLTPAVWAHDFEKQLPLSLALYLAPHGVSLFPLLPWTAFILAGCVCAYLFLRHPSAGWDARRIKRATLVALGMILIGMAGRYVPVALPGASSYFTTSPLYVLVRLGFVLLLALVLLGLEKSRGFAPRSILTAGQESLLVYGVHLWLIFAVLRGKHLGPILGLEAGFAGCLATAAAVAFALLALSRWWQRLKRSHPLGVRRGVAAVVLLTIVVFVLR